MLNFKPFIIGIIKIREKHQRPEEHQYQQGGHQLFIDEEDNDEPLPAPQQKAIDFYTYLSIF